MLRSPAFWVMFLMFVLTAIGGLIAVGFGGDPAVVVIAGIVAFVMVWGLIAVWGRRSVRRLDPRLHPRFPSPPKSPT